VFVSSPASEATVACAEIDNLSNRAPPARNLTPHRFNDVLGRVDLTPIQIECNLL
jgi:hypothetical protein